MNLISMAVFLARHASYLPCCPLLDIDTGGTSRESNAGIICCWQREMLSRLIYSLPRSTSARRCGRGFNAQREYEWEFQDCPKFPPVDYIHGGRVGGETKASRRHKQHVAEGRNQGCLISLIGSKMLWVHSCITVASSLLLYFPSFTFW